MGVRFILPEGSLESKLLLRREDFPREFHHIKKVLRVSRGAVLEVLSQDSLEFANYKITDIQSNLIEGDRTSTPESSLILPVIALVSRPKNIDEIITKGVELGLGALVFFSGDYSQTRNLGDRAWRLRDQAQCQSGFSTWTSLHLEENLESILQTRPANLITCLSPDQRPERLKISSLFSILTTAKTRQPSDKLKLEKMLQHADFTLVLGAEGGLGESEINLLENAGSRFASLGPSTQRVETAFVSAVSMCTQFYDLCQTIKT